MIILVFLNLIQTFCYKGEMLTNGCKKGPLYILEEAKVEALVAIKSKQASSDPWHQRIRHPYLKLLQVLKIKKDISISSWLNKNSTYIKCQLGKQCTLHFNDLNKIYQFPLKKFIVIYEGFIMFLPCNIFTIIYFY